MSNKYPKPDGGDFRHSESRKRVMREKANEGGTVVCEEGENIKVQWDKRGTSYFKHEREHPQAAARFNRVTLTA